MGEFWNGKRVMVTGGTGFLGKYVVDELMRQGAEVRIVDFRPPGWELPEGVFIEAQITDGEALRAACQGASAVFHLAAMPSIARGTFNEYYRVNVEGTRAVLEAAREAGVKKIVYVSSSTVYGIPSTFPLKETSPTRPMGKYSGTKREAEQLCEAFARGGMDISIIRPRVIIGPGRIGIFSILFERVRSGKPVYILGPGRNVFQFTNVMDMADACLKAAGHPGSDLFNIGSNECLPVREELRALIRHADSRSRILSVPSGLARALLRALLALGISPLVDEQFNIADKDFKLDTSHAQRVLGWQPRYSNLESLLQSYDWYVQHAQRDQAQYRNLFGVLGKFRHSKMGSFQTDSLETSQAAAKKKRTIQRYWSENVPGLNVSSKEHETGSKEFYLHTDAFRYHYDPYIIPLIQSFAKQGRRILEVGCGLGTDSRTMARMGAAVVSLDLSPSNVGFTLKGMGLLQINGRGVCADAEHLPFKDGVFDVVYSFGVLHHTPDTAVAINEAHRVLKTQGEAVVMLYHKGYAYYVLWLRYGYRRILSGMGLESLMSKYDHTPLSKLYSKREAERLFLRFRTVSLSMTTYGGARANPVLKYVWRLLVKCPFLMDRFGSFLIIRGIK